MNKRGVRDLSPLTFPEDFEVARREFEIDLLTDWWAKEAELLGLEPPDEPTSRLAFGLLVDGLDETVVSALLSQT